MLLGQELKFKNKLCNFKRVPFSVTSLGIALGNVDKKQSRPERAKAFNIKAFALSGRLFCICFKTQGDALG